MIKTRLPAARIAENGAPRSTVRRPVQRGDDLGPGGPVPVRDRPGGRLVPRLAAGPGRPPRPRPPPGRASVRSPAGDFARGGGGGAGGGDRSDSDSPSIAAKSSQWPVGVSSESLVFMAGALGGLRHSISRV